MGASLKPRKDPGGLLLNASVLWQQSLHTSGDQVADMHAHNHVHMLAQGQGHRFMHAYMETELNPKLSRPHAVPGPRAANCSLHAYI